ncbi:hypothetical protein GCM10010909_36620 [Acidocella aquatica]|uniref:Uncharacterized protein n=1 Tax=Acidocella aquatica TaxID=1922313 RepID=A0ABQ6A919_9PROT|nr:hypothetical protein GCM10010909_36620 [Acidocella aquatica]
MSSSSKTIVLKDGGYRDRLRRNIIQELRAGVDAKLRDDCRHQQKTADEQKCRKHTQVGNQRGDRRDQPSLRRRVMQRAQQRGDPLLIAPPGTGTFNPTWPPPITISENSVIFPSSYATGQI